MKSKVMNAEQTRLLVETEFRFYVLQVGEEKIRKYLLSMKIDFPDLATFPSSTLNRVNGVLRSALRSNLL